MVLNDRQIKEYVEKYRMIEPFVDRQVQEGVVSYGLSSYGYDIRIADEFLIFKMTQREPLITPKAFNPDYVTRVKKDGDPLILKPGQYALGKSVEYIRMPRDLIAICMNKSTYARCGLIVNITPVEACYSEDTEILTNEGWKFFHELTGSEKVLTLNENFEAEYKPIERIQKYYYDGRMIGFKHREIDLLVTPEHKLFVGKYFGYRGRHGLRWFTCEATNILGYYNYYFTREVNWRGNESIVEDWMKDEWFLKFLGIYIGDGCSYIRKGGHIIKLCVVTNERKKKVFEEILYRLASNFNLRIQRIDRGFSFFSKKIFGIVNKLGHAPEKYIPQEFLELPPKYLNHIWYGLVNSDGNLETETYTTTSKKLADNVQELLFKAGYSAIIRKVKSRIKNKDLQAYRIRKTTNRRHKFKPYQMYVLYYRGWVYDITAKDNHIIFVRRNGMPVWSGNCWEGHLTIELANPTQYRIAIYPNEGIAQLIFLKGEPCEISYADKKGKYQEQKDITLPKIK